MAKASRKKIQARGQVEVSTSTGTSNVPAAVRASAMAPSRGGSYVASNRFANSGFANLSGTFRELATRMEKMEDRAYAEAKQAEDRQFREAERQRIRAENREEAKFNALQSAAGLDAGLRFINDALAKVHKGEYSNSEALLADFSSSLDGLTTENAAFISSYTSAAGGFMEKLSLGLTEKLGERTSDNLLGTIAQAQKNIYENLDSITPEQFVEYHNQLLQNSTTSGLPQDALETAMVKAYSNEYIEASVSDADRATKLYDMSKRWSKTLTSKKALDELSATHQAGLAKTVTTADREESKTAQADAKQKSSDYSNLLGEITRLDKAELVIQTLATWDAKPDELETKLGTELATQLQQETRRHRDYLENRENAEWRKLAELGDRAIGEYGERLFLKNENITLPEISNDDRLLPHQKTQLWKMVSDFESDIKEPLEKFVVAGIESLLPRLPVDAAWVGGYQFNEHGNVELDSKVQTRIETRLRKSAYSAYKSIDPLAEDAAEQRLNAVQEAVKSTIDDVLKNGHLYNFEAWEETKAKTGEVRPKATHSVDLEKFPEQKADIERGLFSSPSGLARTGIHESGNSYSIPFNVKYYESLSEEGQKIAVSLLQVKAVEEYMKRYKAATEQWSIWQTLRYGDIEPGFTYEDYDYTPEELQNRYNLDLTSEQ